MVSNLARYVARHPRYTLQPHDNTLVRVAGPQQIPWEEGTEIHDVSLTGLSFTAPNDLCPLLGETIKIQFEAPGQEQMACLALVVRMTKIGRTNMLVAVKFLQLEMGQRLALAQGLASKLKQQSDQKALEIKEFWWEKKQARLLLAFVLGTLWLTLIGWFWFRIRPIGLIVGVGLCDD